MNDESRFRPFDMWWDAASRVDELRDFETMWDDDDHHAIAWDDCDYLDCDYPEPPPVLAEARRQVDKATRVALRLIADARAYPGRVLLVRGCRRAARRAERRAGRALLRCA